MTAQKLIRYLEDRGSVCCGYLFDRYTCAGLVPFHDGKALVREAFEEKSPLVFISAAGIAVRLIAPLVRDKRWDSPVLVIDPQGQYVIPILSGHIGGANALARCLAEALGAKAILTTATDAQGRFAVDTFAAQHDCAIDDMRAAKEIAVRALTGAPVRIWADPQVRDLFPELRDTRNETCGRKQAEEAAAYEMAQTPDGADVVISMKTAGAGDAGALRLVPRRLVAGVGCRRGAGKDDILSAIRDTLQEQQFDLRALCALTSIDRKEDEPGMREAAGALGVPFLTFPAATLAQVPGSVSASAFVQDVTGVDNVCERSALTSGTKLLIQKTVKRHVTVAAALTDFEFLLFGGTTEGKELVEFLEQTHRRSLVLVATPYGAEVLPSGLKYVRVLVGRQDAPQMEKLFEITRPRCVIDATHPYAERVSAAIRAAAVKTGRRVIRVKREETPEIKGAAYFSDAARAAAFLSRTDGNILLTTGSKDLPVYAGVRDAKERLYARVLPHSVQAAREAGIREEHILAAEGPFTMEENVRAIRGCGARFLVTKDSGAPGGMAEKVRAAEVSGCALLVIRRPREDAPDAVSVSRCQEVLRDM